MADALAGKVAIVTGAGHSIGRAIALRFAEAGARLMLTDADDEALAETVELVEAVGDEVASFSDSGGSRLGAANLVAATLDAYDEIDVLINDPRTAVAGEFASLSAESFTAALETTVTSSFLLAQTVARRMITQAEADEDFRGAIVNISSIAAQRTVPELLAYSVACAALDQLTRSMAAALAEHRIRVNGIALGAVMTERLREALRERSDLRGEMIRVTPLGRIGEPEEAAEAALFLASPRAGFVTGQIVAVDGGRTVLDPFASPVR